MWKDYWYVMIPVHCVTSVGWFGGFYVLCKSGVDVAALLGHFGVSDAYLEKVSSSSLSYVALAYACYKIATPVRYTVTIGGTTVAIRHLRSLGYLKTTKDIRSNMKETQVELKQKRDKLLLDFRQRKEQKRDEWIKAWEGFASKRRQKKE